MPSAFKGILAGAAAAYLLDPVQGSRRRALVRDKTLKAYRDVCEFADTASRDLQNRAAGVKAHPSALVGMARREFTQRNWSPAARVVSGGGGAALMLIGMARGGLSGLLAFLAGGALLARAGANRPLSELPQSARLENLSTTEAKESA